jgi:hypothetical protein
MDPLIMESLRELIYMLVLACIATAAAFFWRRPPDRQPVSGGAILCLVLLAGVFMFVVSLIARAVFGFTAMSADNVVTIGRIVLPLIAGFWFAHSRLMVLWTGSVGKA